MNPSADHDALAAALIDVAPLIVRAMERGLREQAQRADPTHVQILSMLVERSHTISELAGRQQVSLPSMSKTVQTLVERGWIERTSTPDDQRIVLVKLTVSGGDALREARTVMLHAISGDLAALTPRERTQLAAGLDALGAALRRAADDAPRL